MQEKYHVRKEEATMAESAEPDPKISEERLLEYMKWQKKILKLLTLLLIVLLLIAATINFQYLTVTSITHVMQVFYVEETPEQPPTSPKPRPTKSSPFVLDTKGCRIPNLYPFDQWIHDQKALPIICQHGNLPLILANSTSIFVNPQALEHYYPTPFKVDCCFRTFYRSVIRDNRVLTSTKCNRFEDARNIGHEFIKVECRLPNRTLYEDFFAFVNTKSKVEEYSRAFGSPMINSQRKLSVLVVGMNSVSRMNLHRSMPRTVELLRQMGAIEMLGYNKVGYNMYENLVPVLSGMPHEEFEKKCWNKPTGTFDSCPFVWNEFMNKGYRTILAEDNCNTTIFNHLKPGFKRQPTDYYLRPLCLAAEPRIGNADKWNAYMCQGARYTFDKMLHYTANVAEKFADDPYFAVSWETSLTHDFMEDAQLGDDSYYRFLRKLLDSSLLRNTALVFMSDHGMRWGSFRWTYQGRLEENLPFAFVRLPDWWKARNPIAYAFLKRNAERLTTPFDMHATFRDILALDDVLEEQVDDKSNKYGKSLFKPILQERTCESAGIPEHWCSCHHRHEVSKENATLEELGGFLVQKINKKLAKQSQCAELQLSSVIDAKTVHDVKYEQKIRLAEDEDYSDTWNWVDYSLVIQTVPGKGIFEGTVRYNGSDSMELVGFISRLNIYADQSSCVDDFDLRFYCYCKE